MTDGPFGSKLKSEHYRDDGPRVIRLQNIGDGTFVDARAHIAEDHYAALHKHRVFPGDVVIAALGENPPRSCLVPDWLGPAIVKADCIRFKAGPRVLPKFVNYVLNGPELRRHAKGIIHGVGRPRLNLGEIKSLPIPVPPIAEQEGIVAEIEMQFTRLDAGVAALKRVQANLKRYRAAVLKAACEGRLVPTEAELARKERRTYETGADLLARILKHRRDTWEGRVKYAEPAPATVANLPSIPHGWTWATAESLCSAIVSGSTPPPEEMAQGSGDVPFLKVYNLTFGGLPDFSIKPTFISRKTHNGRLARSVVRPGDILTNIVGPPLGKVSVVPDTFEEWNINQAIVAFRPLDGLAPLYLAHALRSEPVLARLAATSKATAGQFNIQVTTCRKLAVPLPPQAEQARIVAEIERRLSVVDELDATVAANLQRATRLRQSTLQAAFSPVHRLGDLSGPGRGTQLAEHEFQAQGE